MFNKVIQDIKEFNITGAEQITLWGVRAFSYKKAELDDTCQFISTYLINLSKAKKALYDARKNEFALHNALNYIFDKKRYTKTQTLTEIQKDISRRLLVVEKHLDEALIRISHVSEKKIKNNTTITTIGNSTFVEEVLNKVAEHKNINLIVFQGGPEEKGKELITRLSNKLKITYVSDTMMAEVMQHTDLVLLGATGITNKAECITQSGAKTISQLAKTNKISVYIVTDSLKFGKSIVVEEDKPKEELWLTAPRNVTIQNSAISVLTEKEYTGVICEKGIYKPKEFIKAAKESFF